jgi:ABC-2 type transport system ATP-binding protein
MSQRLGLAGAILAEPQALMLDEPANGLDPQSITWLREFLRHYAAQGRAVLVSSHLLSEMQLMADRVVVIAKGRLIADGTVDELVSGSVRSDVLIRCSDPGTLRSLLSGEGIHAVLEGVDGLAISGADTDRIGEAAFRAGVVVRELTARRASLEEAFLELTGDEQQFRTGGGTFA